MIQRTPASMPTFRRLHPQIVAHRGWTDGRLENSADAIEAAVAAGCRAVEFDVRCTSDGEWVIYHDPDLRRLHHSDAKIEDEKYAELRRQAPLALLGEMLAAFHPECLPMIEIKPIDGRGLDSLIALLAPHLKKFPIVCIARSRRVQLELRRALSTLDIYFYNRDWDLAEKLVNDPGIAGFDLWGEGISITERAVRLARLQVTGKRAAVWTINDLTEAGSWLAAGAAWIITDIPWKLGEI